MICRRDRFGLIAIAVSSLLAMTGCAQPASEVPPLERARAELAAGHPLKAEVILLDLLQQTGRRDSLAGLLGEAALASGDLNAARQWLEPSEFSQGTQAHGFQMLGRLKMIEGDLASAGRWFDKALAAGSNAAGLWVDIGRLRYRGGEHFQASVAVERALELDPGNAVAMQFRGQLARDAESLDTAFGWFARAVEARPDDTDLLIDYAATLGDAGRASDALKILRSGDGSAADSPRGLYLQAVIAARAGNALLARDLLRRSRLLDDEMPSALLLSALIDLNAENFAAAAQQLDRLHSLQPDNRRIAELLALALSRSGSERELIRRFSKLAASSAGSPYLRTTVGRAYEAVGDRVEAARLLDWSSSGNRALIPLEPHAPSDFEREPDDYRGMAIRDDVRTSIGAGRPADAVRHAREYVSNRPGSGDAYAILGDAELANGNPNEALAAFRHSASIRRTWPLVLRMAWSQPDVSARRKLFEEFVRDNPMNAEAASILASLYAEEGDWLRAANIFDDAIEMGMDRVPWVLAARSKAAAQLGDSASALAYAIDAHALQPMNSAAISVLVAALPEEHAVLRAELQEKLRDLTSR